MEKAPMRCENCGHKEFAIRAVCTDRATFICTVDQDGEITRESEGHNEECVSTDYGDKARCENCGHTFSIHSKVFPDLDRGIKPIFIEGEQHVCPDCLVQVQIVDPETHPTKRAWKCPRCSAAFYTLNDTVSLYPTWLDTIYDTPFSLAEITKAIWAAKLTTEQIRNWFVLDDSTTSNGVFVRQYVIHQSGWWQIFPHLDRARFHDDLHRPALELAGVEVPE
ncbi:MAG: hypothetical protein JEZ11_13160 [Desulfobacterales bacterium]|nr:hypothetical protein [Desulfobacterales bacterium]